MHGLEGRFEEVARRRPFALLAPTAPAVAADGAGVAVPQPAPYVALTGELLDPAASARLTLESGEERLSMTYAVDSGRIGLEVADATRTTTHRSRRFGRCPTPPRQLALTLTGPHLTAFAHDSQGWTARGRVDLRDRLDTHAEDFLAELLAVAEGTATAECGGFGQLGLRDLRFVTTTEGEPVREGGCWLLTATHAGPGFFDAGHTGVWSLEAETWALTHRADLFFRRSDRPGVYGDNASHLVLDGDRWLVATSTWGDLDLTTPERRRRATVGITLAESTADLTRGRHVLDTRALALPTDGLGSVAAWDPYLVRDDRRWLVGFVSAKKLFRFHPAVAGGPTLDDLELLSADPGRRATEGTTLLRTPQGWRVVASDGRDGRRGQRKAYPVFDLGLNRLGQLDAPYLTNLPWPALARDPDRPGHWLMVAFNGSAAGGDVLGYGTHGDVVVLRS